MTAPRVGVLLPTREHALQDDWAVRPLLDFARRAEALGFDSVWAGDSLSARPRHDPLTLLAAVTATTERITIGTAALTALTRQPVVAAQTIATLDRAAEGRLILGLGAGFPSPDTTAELRMAGVPVGGRLERLAATVRRWRELWRGQVVDGFPAPSRPEGPPLWFAGAGPRGLALAGDVFDGWLPYLPDPADYAATRRALPDRDGFTAALYVTVLLDDDVERAEKHLDAYTQSYYRAPLAALSQLQAFVYGPLDACVQRLRAYVDAGASHLVLRIGSLAPADRLDDLAALRLAIAVV